MNHIATIDETSARISTLNLPTMSKPFIGGADWSELAHRYWEKRPCALKGVLSENPIELDRNVSRSDRRRRAAA